MTRYLRRVKEQWTLIIGGSEEQMLLADPNTIHLLQGLCPGLSSADRASVQMGMLSGELFPAIKNNDIRSQILERLCSIKNVIISLHTFLEDTKYLEPCARILKQLLPTRCKGSLSQHFQALHSGQSTIKVQTSEFGYRERELSSSSYSSWVSYRVIWLFALRHFPGMDRQAPRQDIGKPNMWQPGLQSLW